MVQTANVLVNNHSVRAAQLRAGCLVGTWDSPNLSGTCQAQQQLALAESVPGVLVSAGIELIFFLVAGTVLGFGFSVRIVLITH